ncbi:hypothetical protein FB468_0983 [Leucobacter komagatae]|uniref:Major capsid protein n=1 Tax=Leucobacter komagatae TaxID=55969 RepID=A0A542Y4H5_9MICO|nr:hypothetical protein [Leucobacter komagatae]TQL42972.1 hypothetical protein FB468_0983 [Leucobacter komagatae]
MARGILTGGDVLTTTLDGISLENIWDEYIETLRVWNDSRSPIASLFTSLTAQSGAAISQAAEGDDFEEASTFGKPKSIRAEATPLTMGFPLKWYDSAIRYTEAFLRDATSSEVQAQHSAALEADNRLLFRQIMRALLTKTTIATRPVNENGATIYSLWDGEADATPPSFAGKEFAAGHKHYLTTQSAELDGVDLRDLINDVTEHGYGTAAGEKMIVLVHPNQGEVVRSFRAGQAGPGGVISPFDFIPSAGAPAFLSSEQIIGDKPPATYAGLDVIGSYGGALIVEDYYVPSGYVIATATGSRTPLAFREHQRIEYKGLRLIPGDKRYPLVDATYARGFGVGVQHRGAAAVMQVTTSADYTSPTF